MTPLERQIKNGESQEVVLLRSADHRDRIASHVVALLNSGGGSIMIGVDESGHVADLPNAVGMAHELARHLRAIISPRPLISVTAEEVFGGNVILIEVPGGRDVPFLVEGRVFLRRGKSTVMADAEDLQEIFQRRTPETVRWERRGAPTLTLGDLHHEQIETMVQKAIGDGRFPFSDPQSIETVLGELGMCSGGVLTNAADVCFGIKPAIRNPQVRMRAYAFQSDKRGDEYLDQDDFNGPLANVLASAVAFIQRNSSRAAMFLPESVERQNLAAYPTTAVREGLVNALAHRDYSRFSSGASILVYPDRLEIWNSGKLPDGWTASKLRQNHPSIPTNPDIANFLFIRSLMERIGRGTQRMIEDCREAGLPAPIWRVDEDGITLTLYSQGSPEAPASRLNERQLGLLNALSDGDTIRLRDYLERFAEGVTERQAQRDLSELRDADLLRLERRGRATHYVRTKRRTPE
jgi:ATP-dependent DNA helicase RecG